MILSHEISDKSCLIGHTGFVGGHLAQQARFASFFNSQNIAQIQGQTFDTVVCAAAPGSMFEANKFPEKDKLKIQALIDQLATVKAERFILISSIAVLENFADEQNEETSSFQDVLAYGRHRRQLEAFVEEHFSRSLIVRLPALFGLGLRKNFIFDLLNPIPAMLTEEKLEGFSNALNADLAAWVRTIYLRDPIIDMFKIDRSKLSSDCRKTFLEEAAIDLGFSATQFHNPKTTYQYYEMTCLWSDIEIAKQAELSHIHLVSEPLEAAIIHERLIGQKMPQTSARIHHEDMHTMHAALWQTSGPYLRSAETIMDRLFNFYASQKAAR